MDHMTIILVHYQLAVRNSLVKPNRLLLYIDYLICRAREYHGRLANLRVSFFEGGRCRYHHCCFLCAGAEGYRPQCKTNGELLSKSFIYRVRFKHFANGSRGYRPSDQR